MLISFMKYKIILKLIYYLKIFKIIFILAK